MIRLLLPCVWLAAAACAYQDQPAYMAAESPLTKLRHLRRLRWRLEGLLDRQVATAVVIDVH